MDSTGAYSPKNGLLEAVDMAPDVLNANRLADRFEN